MIQSSRRYSFFLLMCVFALQCAQNLAVQSLFAQEADDVQPNTPLFLQADKLIGNVSPSGFTRELIGNVVLTQGPVRVTCNRAMHYVEQNRADLFGNVVLTQGATTMKSAQGVYDGAARTISGSGGVELFDGKAKLTARTGIYSTAIKVARFFASVRIENDSLIITSDSLEYHRSTQNSYATGKVTAVGKFTSAYLQGDSLTNINADKYTRLSNYAGNGQAMVSQIDTVLIENSGESVSSERSSKKDGQKNEQKSELRNDTTRIKSNTKSNKRLDTLCITGNVLEAFRKDSNELYIATGSVQMTRRNLAGRADKGIYEKNLSRIRFYATTTATPVLWLDSTQLRGDSLLVQLRAKRLERITAYTNAFAATKNDTSHQERIDQLSGENIIVEANNDTIRVISAEGKAFNLYFAQSENETTNAKEPDGAVKNAADTVRVLFERGELDNIVWRGKVEGEYIPETIVQKQLQTLRLKGFEWVENRPLLWRGMTQGVKQYVPQNAKQTASPNPARNRASKGIKTSQSTKKTSPGKN